MENDAIPAGATGAPEAPRHQPVMLAEVLEALAPVEGETFIDGTFGAGGYTTAILETAPCRVLALDRDITAVRAGEPLSQRFGDRLILVNAPFSEMEDEAARALPPGAARVDGVVLDIGVSSMQLDEAWRGFSFQADGPLDMRMSPPVDPVTGHAVASGPTAADFLNAAAEEDIANVLFDLGEEKKSRLIARAIVHDRATTPFTSTRQLAGLVSRLLGGRKDDGRHPATRTFQALRIHVNDELGELERGLAAAERLLKPGGRLVIVTFHSLEDRIVKRFLIERSGREPQGSRHLPPSAAPKSAASFRIVNQRPLRPSQPELERNPRARSAGLRAAIRTDGKPLS